MARSFLNPKQSDYPGRFKLAAAAFALGLAGFLLGWVSGAETLTTLLCSAGVGVMIGAGILATATWQSRTRAERTRKG